MSTNKNIAAVIFIIFATPSYSQTYSETEQLRIVNSLQSRISTLESKVADGDRRISQLERNLSQFGNYEAIAILSGSVDDRLLNLERAQQKKKNVK